MDSCGFFEFIKNLFMLKYLPEISNDTGLGILFVLGLLTSLHCLGMCGGIAISQTIKSSKEGRIASKLQWMMPSVLYNGGRVIGYTVVGAVIGELGRVIGFSGILKGLVPLVGGILMIIMGINLLGIFPFLRKFNIRMPYFIARKLTGKHNYGPFVVGLLTSLMPCGPLQIVQLYALGTRSVIGGASAMFVFSLGTLPLLFLFGVVNSLINKKHTNVVLKLSSVIVIVLGFVMVGRGLALSGYSVEISRFANSNSAVDGGIAKIDGNIQTVTTSLESESFPEITVQKGIPVRWIIKAREEELNGCNNAIIIPKLNMEVSFQVGDNIVEFTADEAGEIPYTCWMGMIKSKINVVDKLPD
jgi:sulfite exporter TauE/SafE